MAKPKHDRKCTHVTLRSPSHPVADLPCGAPAKWFLNMTNGKKEDLCGTHANYWRNRGYVPSPIIAIKSEPEPTHDIGVAYPAEHGQDGHRCSGFCPHYGE